MITRFAPTPSGYLHEGNAVNALLVNWLAQAHGGTTLLRIDDADTARARPEYVEDIHDVLRWLDIAATPAHRADVTAYRAALGRARANGLDLYACSCSRRDLGGTPAVGGCPGDCRALGRRYAAGETAIRVHVPIGSVVQVQDTDVDLADRVGDFVVWRRDDLPAYHLASVVDDLAHGVTHVVRGMDLIESTAAQLFLGRFLDGELARVRFVHHALLLDASGGKLSKSQLSRGEPLSRTEETRAGIIAAARTIGEGCGISPRHGLRSHA